jgi:hypothetical protein
VEVEGNIRHRSFLGNGKSLAGATLHDLAPPNRGCPNSTRIDGTLVPVEEVGEHVTSVFSTYSTVSEQLHAGKLRALAAGSRARIEPLPEVPASLLRILRGSAYEAAKRKEIPTIRIGRRLLGPPMLLKDCSRAPDEGALRDAAGMRSHNEHRQQSSIGL